MNRIHFERHFRTSFSESYYIVNGTARLGKIDVHFTTTAVRGTLILIQELDEVDIIKIIQQIDEDIILSADVARDDFFVSVCIGKDVGFYSDEYNAEQNNNP